MRFRMISIAAVVAAFSALTALSVAPQHAPQAAVAGQAQIDPAVVQALQQDVDVPVIISLQPPAVTGTPTVGEMHENTASRQANVLNELAPSEFTVTYAYSTIEALAGRLTSSGLATLAVQPDVAAVALDRMVFGLLEESVSLIQAGTVHDQGFTGSGVNIAVLDSGIDSDHPDLLNGVIGGSCFLEDISDCPAFPSFPAEDDRGHGSHVSGIITSDGALAGFGVAPEASLYSYKVLDATGQGAWSGILAALNDIITNHGPGDPLSFDFVNMSFGDGLAYTPLNCSQFYQTTATAFRLLREQGTIAFVSSGNSGFKDGLSFPACLSSVMSVGAVYDASIASVTWTSPEPDCADTNTQPDLVACGSQSSNDLDLVAPGALIRSDWPFAPFTHQTFGTSMAAPHALGVAALLKQVRPDLSPDEIENRLKLSGTWVLDDFHDGNAATGRWSQRVDARVALLSDDNADFDGDGCSNGHEFGQAANAGGLRNPLNPYDYLNPTHDGLNRVDDILAVVNQYFIDQVDPGYNPGTDRTALGPNSWNLGAPNGQQRVDDILAEVKQYFHDCS